MSNQVKLLEGLSGPGITVNIRSLAKYMASNGVLVTPHVGRQRGYIPLSAATYGVDVANMSKEGGEFYQSRASQGHLCFVPPEDEAELAKLEKRLRRAIENRALQGEFMPMTAYTSLKKEFEEIRELYFNKRDEILSRWQALQEDFKIGVAAMLAGIQIPEAMRRQLLGEYVAAAPSAAEYKRSFRMDLRVHAFPADVEHLTGLESSVAADVSETWKEETVQTAILAIERQVGIGWEKMMKAMGTFLRTNTIPGAGISGLIRYATELEWKNIFRNPLLSELSDTLKKLSVDSLPSDKAQIIEDAVTYAYGYAAEAGIALKMDDCPYTKQQLEVLRSTYIQNTLRLAN